MNAAVVEILRREASDDETIVGRTYRHRASGKVYVVTEVVGRHRHGAEVLAETDGDVIYPDEGSKIVLDGRLHVSPGAFVRHWVEAAADGDEVGP